ncbi:hypothetical protein BD289DRAFT_428888 [Coniella lustricola]|uniref:Uncharacterized protein n=1 Tax=Coniella lustricola TaxID=2025994 RepID=A0A2T3ADP7_9PEZI|nr:hypothetical protein BD289DRAFT_428888 [Coniella lustricola]
MKTRQANAAAWAMGTSTLSSQPPVIPTATRSDSGASSYTTEIGSKDSDDANDSQASDSYRCIPTPNCSIPGTIAGLRFWQLPKGNRTSIMRDIAKEFPYLLYPTIVEQRRAIISWLDDVPFPTPVQPVTSSRLWTCISPVSDSFFSLDEDTSPLSDNNRFETSKSRRVALADFWPHNQNDTAAPPCTPPMAERRAHMPSFSDILSESPFAQSGVDPFDDALPSSGASAPRDPGLEPLTLPARSYPYVESWVSDEDSLAFLFSPSPAARTRPSLAQSPVIKSSPAKLTRPCLYLEPRVNDDDSFAPSSSPPSPSSPYPSSTSAYPPSSSHPSPAPSSPSLLPPSLPSTTSISPSFTPPSIKTSASTRASCVPELDFSPLVAADQLPPRPARPNNVACRFLPPSEPSQLIPSFTTSSLTTPSSTIAALQPTHSFTGPSYPAPPMRPLPSFSPAAPYPPPAIAQPSFTMPPYHAPSHPAQAFPTSCPAPPYPVPVYALPSFFVPTYAAAPFPAAFPSAPSPSPAVAPPTLSWKAVAGVAAGLAGAFALGCLATRFLL